MAPGQEPRRAPDAPAFEQFAATRVFGSAHIRGTLIDMPLTAWMLGIKR